MSDEDSFSNLVGDDVTPIKADQRVALDKQNADRLALENRRRAAAEAAEALEDPLAGEPMEQVGPSAILSFQRPGVQNGVFRNLRLGKYSLEARLDLHRMGVDHARRQVYQFIKDCLTHDVRTALVTHGKGEGREKPAMLKSCIAYWLPQLDEVLAFHTAQKQHGGYGATYVLLKKSDKKRQETRDKFAKEKE